MADDRLYLDTNIFIYAFENNDLRAKMLLKLIASNEGRRRPFLATSEISLAELIIGPLKDGSENLVELYENLSIGNAFILVGTITREVLWHAAQLRASYTRLRLPDAIHLATAMHFGCARFLTGDTKLADTYSIALNPLVPHKMTAEIVIIQPEISVLDTLITEFSS